MRVEPADVDLLHRMADAADGLTRSGWRSDDLEVEIKDDGSPVTPVDRAVEETLLGLVRAAHPDDGFLGEEVGAHPGPSGRTWVVDGIDGTRNFVAGRPNWSTLVALTVGDTIRAGTITSPARSQRWSTTADGQAVRRDGDQTEPSATLSVSTVDDLVGDRIAVWPPESWLHRRLDVDHQAVLDVVGRARSSSDLIGEHLCHGAIPVADGRLDAMIAFSGQAWDHAGPAAVVTAAGGRFSALDGSPAFGTGAGLYSNGRIHDRLLDILAAG